MDNIQALLKRIKTSTDGPDFIDYLNELSRLNYEAYKRDGIEMNDIHKGYAIAIDSLVDSFLTCDKEVVQQDIQEHWN